MSDTRPPRRYVDVAYVASETGRSESWARTVVKSIATKLGRPLAQRGALLIPIEAWDQHARSIGLRTQEDDAAKAILAEATRHVSLSCTSFVYFIAAGYAAIKIGVANDPRQRLGELQVGNHVALELLATVRGDSATEDVLHEKFAAHYIRGEWFHHAPEIITVARVARIESIR